MAVNIVTGSMLKGLRGGLQQFASVRVKGAVSCVVEVEQAKFFLRDRAAGLKLHVDTS